MGEQSYIGRRRVGRVLVPLVVGTAAAVAAACTPTTPPGPPAEPTPPVIEQLDLVARRVTSPVVGSLVWRIADPNPDLLRCRVDIDGDGSFDRELTPCSRGGAVLVELVDPGSHVLTLEVSDGVHDPVVRTTTVVVGEGPGESYEITLRLDPSMRPVFRQAFEDAAARWSEVIVAGAPDQQLDLPEGFLGWIPAWSGPVDDVVIDARDTPMDGPRGVLGRAAGLAVREGDWQPYWGLMEFDTDDLEMLHEQGRLSDVVLHEMGHVLGLGGSWLLSGLVDNPLFDPGYVGRTGMTAYAELGGGGAVPLENGGGLGTVWGHWRESTFGRELMTGYLNPGEQYLSRLTVGALADQGYGVSLAAADAFELPDPAATAAARAGAVDAHADHLHTESMEPLIVGGRPR